MRNERSSSARMGWELHAIATFALHRSTDATLADIQLSGRELADKLNMPDKTRSAASWVDRAGTFGLRHSRFIARSDRAELVAVADPAFGSDRPVPDELRDLARYTDHREMLARGDLDGVIVASPSEMHVSHALDCLDAGVAVLIEKPVAVDREQARPLLDRLVDDPEARVLVGHHRRHHPAVAAARSLIEEGRLGEIRTVAAIWATHKSDPYFEVEWRRRRPGGGMLLINLIHEVDMLRHLVGEIVSVKAIASNKARARGRGHRGTRPAVRERGHRHTGRFRQRGIAVGLGPGHRGRPHLPLPRRAALPSDRGFAGRSLRAGHGGVHAAGACAGRKLGYQFCPGHSRSWPVFVE